MSRKRHNLLSSNGLQLGSDINVGTRSASSSNFYTVLTQTM